MQYRSRLAWLGAFALVLVVPPVASSVVGDLDPASVSSEKQQDARLGRYSKLLTSHGKQIRDLRRVEYGLGYMATDTDRLEAIRGSVIMTGAIPRDGTTRAMASRTVQFTSTGGEVVGLYGAIRSSEVHGAAAVFIGGGAATGALIGVCAGSSCGGGTVKTGETVCSIHTNYDSSTGVLTLVDIPQKSSLSARPSPNADDPNIAGGKCTLPPGGGAYNFIESIEYRDR